MMDSEPAASQKETRVRRVKRWLPWAASVLSFVLLLPLFYNVANKRLEEFNSEKLNGESEIDHKIVPIVFHYDQHVYLNTGRLMKMSDYEYFSPRHRTPGYPFLLSLLYSEADAYPLTQGDSRRVSDAYFARGQLFNIITSMLCIVAIFFFLIRIVSVWTSLMFSWAIAWFYLIFRAPFVQPEALFAVLAFFAFVLLARQIIVPSWPRGIATGILLAACFMLKAAILPLLALFVACFALKFMLKLIGQFKKREIRWGDWLHEVAKGAVIPILFVTLLSPYLLNTYKKHGTPFWSVHSQHFMWLENREDKHQWRHLLDIIDENDGVVPEGAPSKERFFTNHTLLDFVNRSQLGSVKSIGRISRDYRDGYRFLFRRLIRIGIAVAVLGLILAIPIIRRKFADPKSPDLVSGIANYWILIVYAVLFVLGYSLLYGNYQVIGAGPRLFLSMYPVVLFCIWYFVEKYSPIIQIRKFSLRLFPIFQGILALCLILEIIHCYYHEVYRVAGAG